MDSHYSTTIQAAPGIMTVFVKVPLGREQVPLHLSPRLPLLQLKKEIERVLDVPVAGQVLYSNGKELGPYDHQTLGSCGIPFGALIYVLKVYISVQLYSRCLDLTMTARMPYDANSAIVAGAFRERFGVPTENCEILAHSNYIMGKQDTLVTHNVKDGDCILVSLPYNTVMAYYYNQGQ